MADLGLGLTRDAANEQVLKIAASTHRQTVKYKKIYVFRLLVAHLCPVVLVPPLLFVTFISPILTVVARACCLCTGWGASSSSKEMTLETITMT